MKTFLILAIATSISSVIASHHVTFHVNHQGHSTGHHQNADLIKSLKLTDSQTQSIKEIRLKAFKQLLIASHQGQAHDRAKHEKHMAKTLDAIKAVLTDSQIKTLASKGGPGVLLDMGAAHLDLLAQLHLSDAQTAKVNQIIKNTHEAMAKAHQDKGQSQEDLHRKMMGLHEETMKQIQQVLTPEQIQRFHEIMSDGSAQ